MTPNKPIGTAKVELPEFYTEEMLEARCHKAVAWHIRALQAYIQQPSPLVEENRRLKEALERAAKVSACLAGMHFEDGEVMSPIAQLSVACALNEEIQVALAQPETKGER